MRVHRAIGLVLPALTILAFLPSQAAAGEQDTAAQVDRGFAIRGSRELPAKAVEYLATKLQPIKVTPAQDTTLGRLVETQCGDGLTDEATGVLRRKVQELNPGTVPSEASDAAIAAGTALLFPFCAAVEKAKNVPISGSIERTVRSAYPYAENSERRVRGIVKELCDEGSGQPCMGMDSNELVPVPYSPTSVGTVKPGTSPADVQAHLETLVSKETFDVEKNSVLPQAGVLEYVPNIKESNSVAPVSAPCGTSTSGAPWPFDENLVWDRFTRARASAQAKPSVQVPKQANMALIDSGFSEDLMGGDKFPDKFFWVNNGEDGDFPNAMHGIGFDENLGKNGNFFAFHEDDYKDHGTEVATLALGGPAFMAKIAADTVDPPIQFAMVRASVRTSITPPKVVPGSTFFPAALEWLRLPRDEQNFKIVNVSLKHKEQFSDYYENHTPNTLVVAAAGNEGKNVKDVPNHYPAYNGGMKDIAVITVGAHDRRREILPSSNYGVENVDLLAPGCEVPTYDLDGNPTKVEGTSFAAPLVSFAAGLLRAEGMRRPREIRNRIISATDYDPKLKDRVWSSGVLDVPKAISIYDDVVEVRQAGNGPAPEKNELVFGQLNLPCASSCVTEDVTKALLRFCALPDRTRNPQEMTITKMSLYRGEQSNALRVRYLFDRNGGERTLDKMECALAPDAPPLSFVIRKDASGAGEKREIQVGDIVDVVPQTPIRRF